MQKVEGRSSNMHIIIIKNNQHIQVQIEVTVYCKSQNKQTNIMAKYIP